MVIFLRGTHSGLMPLNACLGCRQLSPWDAAGVALPAAGALPLVPSHQVHFIQQYRHAHTPPYICTHIYSSVTPLPHPLLQGILGALALQSAPTSASLPRLPSCWCSHLEPGLKPSGRSERATARWQPHRANNGFLEWVAGSSSPVEERGTVHPSVDEGEKMLQLGCLEQHSLSAPTECSLASLLGIK